MKADKKKVKSVASKKKKVKKTVKQRQRELKIKVATAICQEYEKGEFTIESICESFSIPYTTFYGWSSPLTNSYIEEVEDLYKKAKSDKQDRYMEKLSHLAKTSLQKRVEGYTVEEVHSEAKPEYDKKGDIIKMVPTKVKTVKKHIAPSDLLIMFALKATDPDTFKDRYEMDVGDKTVGTLFDFLREKGKQRIEEKAKKKPARKKNGSSK